jgi:hypothetical protein
MKVMAGQGARMMCRANSLGKSCAARGRTGALALLCNTLPTGAILTVLGLVALSQKGMTRLPGKQGDMSLSNNRIATGAFQEPE